MYSANRYTCTVRYSKIAFLSLVATIFTFLVSYEVMYYFLDTPPQIDIFVLIVFILLMYPIHKIVHLLFFCLIINLLKSINYLVRNGYHILILMLIRLFTKFIFVLISFYPSFSYLVYL